MFNKNHHHVNENKFYFVKYHLKILLGYVERPLDKSTSKSHYYRNNTVLEQVREYKPVARVTAGAAVRAVL